MVVPTPYIGVVNHGSVQLTFLLKQNRQVHEQKLR